ncbi:hypothetical protein AC477_00255 [miscellaneous Crenarchaeota group-1 archaeon SG8-32-1]|uniref:Uncharacterized protein n=1 Tax=miscellaneous Crenarchaeota group-1 archaeon SG8-32-1 TaxID=1685124 RepID=A0A0M0C186_9ARCH|nr:MAG: hypothetical protein AC477_00255 [miscellaneous Crenarchaeota group-1 archaeon SG8-32-1]
MARGKPWTKKQEDLLRSLVNDKKSIDEISEKLEKTPEAIRVKTKRLGLEVVVDRESTNYCTTTSNEILPEELISMEESLKMLVGALKLACTPGLSKVEVQRLQVVANLTKNYTKELPMFLHLRDVEKRLFEIEEKIVEYTKKTKSNSSSN